MKTKKHDAIVLFSHSEKELLDRLSDKLKNTPVPDDEILANLGLYLTSKNLSRILFFYELYKKIVHSHGAIVEFGVRWGQTLSLMAALRIRSRLFSFFASRRPSIRLTLSPV